MLNYKFNFLLNINNKIMISNYDDIWKAFIRPERNIYKERDLGKIVKKSKIKYFSGTNLFKSG